MTRIQKIKKFIKDHPSEILLGTLVTTGVILAVKLVKDANAEVNAINTWIAEESQKGNLVYQLIDGSFISVKND
jgi:hypothetical protein